MPAPNPPSEPGAALQWLVDREAIRGLVSSFGVAVDDKDREGYAANFTEDAVLELPFGSFTGRAEIAAMPGPPARWGTQHLFGNIVIDDIVRDPAGDTAAVRAYMMATHVFDLQDRTQKASSGGWYEYRVRRTAEGWRLQRVRLVPVWQDERPMIPGARPPAGVSH